MNQLIWDYVAIDTNVFLHLLHRKSGSDSKWKHIFILLKRLKEESSILLVDDDDKIRSQYHEKLLGFMENADERNPYRIILMHWLATENQKLVPMNHTDNLMIAIRKIIPPQNGKDRFFVYVAFKEDKHLITNDSGIYNKRTELKRKTKRFRPNSSGIATILTSQEAHDELHATRNNWNELKLNN